MSVSAPAQGVPAAPAPAAPPANPGSPAPAGDPGGNQPAVATQEDVERIVRESIEGATTKLWGDIKAMLGRQAQQPRGQGAAGDPPATPPAGAPSGSGQQPPAAGAQGNGAPDAIDQRLREMEQRMSAMKAAAVDLAVRDALQAAGVSGDNLVLAQASFRQLHDGQIQARDELGRDLVVGDTNLRDYVKTWLTGQGAAFVPAKRTPQIQGLPEDMAASITAAGGVVEMTRAQAAKADIKLLKSGRVKIID